MRPARGYGLVEVMISLTLGLILSSAVIQAFLASKASNRVQDALGQVQENARFAMRYMGKEIRMAGYLGCGNLAGIPLNNIALPRVEFSLATALTADNDVAAANGFAALAGSDILHLQRASDQSIRITGKLPDDPARVAVEDNRIGLALADYVVISDCAGADIFRIANTPAESGAGSTYFSHSGFSLNSAEVLSRQYGADAEIFALESLHFFVRDSGRRTPRGEPITSLYVALRRAGSGGKTGAATELLEGVEDLQLSFGVDRDGDRQVDTYLDADEVDRWDSILNVELALQLCSSFAIGGKGGPQVYRNLQGKQVEAGDARLRRVFASVFAIRNRLP